MTISDNSIVRPTEESSRAEWAEYWKSLGQTWRIEPEIDFARQQFLEERRAIVPEIHTEIYPFKDVQLNRADIEWLLATHENGRGPIDWNDPEQRKRQGLDLRGADLRGQDLHDLPLARLRGGIYWTDDPERNLTRAQINGAGVHLEGVNFRNCHLEGAKLCHAYMQNTTLYMADLQDAELQEVSLQFSVLVGANLERANLEDAHLEGAFLIRAKLGGANLVGTFVNAACELDGVSLCDDAGNYPTCADTNWGDAVLAVLDFAALPILGDEQKARQSHTADGEPKDRATRLYEYRRAIRANRQLSIAMEAQGLSEEAARFAYNAQKLQRRILFWQGRYGQFFFSGFLDLFAGYGYKPSRSFLAYIMVNVFFATLYLTLGPGLGLKVSSPLEALVFSMTCFHGRGFSPGQNLSLSNPITVFAAIEAFVGLLVELTLIATFTKRLFHN